MNSGISQSCQLLSTHQQQWESDPRSRALAVLTRIRAGNADFHFQQASLFHSASVLGGLAGNMHCLNFLRLTRIPMQHLLRGHMNTTFIFSFLVSSKHSKKSMWQLSPSTVISVKNQENVHSVEISLLNLISKQKLNSSTSTKNKIYFHFTRHLQSYQNIIFNIHNSQNKIKFITKQEFLYILHSLGKIKHFTTIPM